MSDEQHLFEAFDYHGQLVDKALRDRSPVPGEFEDYMKLRGEAESAEEAFNIFIKRWIDPRWWGHLLDDDDNEAEYVRRWIRGEYPQK